jgi:hypothetical protein
MIRCDRGHEHETLDAAVACVRVTKLGRATETRETPESLQPAAVPSTEPSSWRASASARERRRSTARLSRPGSPVPMSMSSSSSVSTMIIFMIVAEN